MKGAAVKVLREPGFFAALIILFVILGLADGAIWYGAQICCNPS